MFINFKFLPNIDAIWVLTKLARWTTISDRKLFLDFLVKSTNCDVTLADCHQNVEIFFFTFWVKLISSERASEEEQNTENRFSIRLVWAELWEFKNILVRPPDP